MIGPSPFLSEGEAPPDWDLGSGPGLVFTGLGFLRGSFVKLCRDRLPSLIELFVGRLDGVGVVAL